MISRRSFLEQALASGALAVTGASQSAALVAPQVRANKRPLSEVGCIELLRPPDSVVAFSGAERRLPLKPAAGAFAANDVRVSLERVADGLAVRLRAGETALSHVRLRWLVHVDPALSCLG
ncbi:MAG TPA: twin-arginine translocation signal domain-containing protein, partial [Longimicrobiales bacterium]